MMTRRIRVSNLAIGVLLTLLSSTPPVLAASIHDYASQQPWGYATMNSSGINRNSTSNANHVLQDMNTTGRNDGVGLRNNVNASSTPWIFDR